MGGGTMCLHFFRWLFLLVFHSVSTQATFKSPTLLGLTMFPASQLPFLSSSELPHKTRRKFQKIPFPCLYHPHLMLSLAQFFFAQFTLKDMKDKQNWKKSTFTFFKNVICFPNYNELLSRNFLVRVMHG